MELYFFGAGASAAEGAPATDQFLAEAWTLLGPDFDQRTAAVWRFLAAVFGEEPTGPEGLKRFPSVDDLFSLVDWALHADQGLGRTYDPARLYEVRQDLEHLVCAALDAAVDRQRRLAGPAEGPYAAFVRELAVLGRRAVLVTLNYDTLLDHALWSRGSEPDYGFGSLDLGSGGPAPASHRPAQLLLKLHGSLNWALCKGCDQIRVLRWEVAHLLPRAQSLRCGRCGSDRLYSMIISPTRLKGSTPSQLRHVWDLALEAIQQAERICFVGYSLPEADVAIAHLLLRGILARPNTGRPPIEVINRNPAAGARFRRLLGPTVTVRVAEFHGRV